MSMATIAADKGGKSTKLILQVIITSNIGIAWIMPNLSDILKERTIV